MQVAPTYVTFLLSLLTFTQYAGVQATLRFRRQHIDEVAKQLLEIEGLEITTPHSLLNEIEEALLKKQQYEFEIQQQQEKLRLLQEQYEYELQAQQRKQQVVEEQRQLARVQEKQRLREYALQQQQQQQQKPQIQQIDPNTEIDLVNDASESDFYERHNDGTYAFGYSLPNGARRFERSYYSDELQSMVVEGFYGEIRDRGKHQEYELHCYRSGPYGYRPMPVRALNHAPLVRRNTTLDDDCFDN